MLSGSLASKAGYMHGRVRVRCCQL